MRRALRRNQTSALGSMLTLYMCCWVALAADIVLFNVLYFCVVLLRILDAGGEVKSDLLLNIRQPKYVGRYLQLLTDEEKTRWYNVFLRHSSMITFVLLLLGLAFFAISLLHGEL